MRWIYGALVAIFLAFALFQLNDPDPEIWVSLYLFAALVSVPPVFGRHTPFPALGLAVYLVWFIMQADTIDVNWWQKEEAREAFGMLFATGWMGILLFAWTRQRHDAASRRHHHKQL